MTDNENPAEFARRALAEALDRALEEYEKVRARNRLVIEAADTARLEVLEHRVRVLDIQQAMKVWEEA